MSLDIWLEHEACPHCGRSDGGIDNASFGYTYNCSKMWYAIFPDAENMVDIDGKTGRESLERLNHAIEVMENDMPRFEEMNPPNNWGSAIGFKCFLKNMRNAAENYPDARWRSWR